MNNMDNEEKKLWHRYKHNNDPEAREALIEMYLWMVKNLTEKILPLAPNYVERGDLISIGAIGLIDALEKYNSEENVKFSTFAYIRIKGELLDYLRNLDWVPRDLRKKIIQLDKTYSELEEKYGREPSMKELATAMKLSEKELHELVVYAQMSNILYLEDEIFDASEYNKDDEELPIGKVLKTRKIDDPGYNMELKEKRLMLIEAIKEALTPEEQEVIALYYYENFSLKEIAKVLEVSEGRVCQHHTKALIKLRRYLHKHQLTNLYI